MQRLDIEKPAVKANMIDKEENTKSPCKQKIKAICLYINWTIGIVESLISQASF